MVSLLIFRVELVCDYLTNFQAARDTLQKPTCAFILVDYWQSFTVITRFGKALQLPSLQTERYFKPKNTNTEHHFLLLRSVSVQYL